MARGTIPTRVGGGDGLPRWTEQDRPIENTDVVLWYTFGHTHIPRPEDYPVMPTAYIGFTLKPNGFFTANPANDVPPSLEADGKLLPLIARNAGAIHRTRPSTWTPRHRAAGMRLHGPAAGMNCLHVGQRVGAGRFRSYDGDMWDGRPVGLADLSRTNRKAVCHGYPAAADCTSRASSGSGRKSS